MDWHSLTNEIRYNPRLTVDPAALAFLKSLNLQGHFYLTTSGTTGSPKWVALSKEAILTSAKAVNDFFGITSKDVWLNVLPLFHVGGIGIEARAHLSESKVMRLDKWNPFEFVKLLDDHQVTFTALVPTQLFDLIVNELKAPKSLNNLIIGGGALSPFLKEKGLTLGWPIVESYGMTECASQIMTDYKLLPHVEAKIEDGKLCIKSEALFTGYAFPNEKVLVDPKRDGWFKTEDNAHLQDGTLKILGRDDTVKILGELVNIPALHNILDKVKTRFKTHPGHHLKIEEDQRLGQKLYLASIDLEQGNTILSEFNQLVLPYERIQEVRVLQGSWKES